MSVSACQIFDFLEGRELWKIERDEIASPGFGSLRRNLRQIISRLGDSDDQLALDIVDGLRPLLSEWLTVPVPFDQSIVDAITDLFGQSEAVEACWGHDIRVAYEAAVRAGGALISSENPMRERLRALIQKLSSQGQIFKIYCHRRARPHFESLLPSFEGTHVQKLAFLHSPSEYRQVEPFDVLVKVGPLRVRGWGSAPDALVTAPRFGTLAQLVWSGSADDPDFGYDPVSPTSEPSETKRPSALRAVSDGHGSLRWTTQVARFGEDPDALSNGSADTAIDDLQFLHDVLRHRDKRSATLVQIDDSHAILYPPHSKVLCFDPNPSSKDPIDYCIPDETLSERMFLIQPNIADVNLGGATAQHGAYSQVWKRRLTEEFHSNQNDLINRLRKAGLNLVHMRSAIEHWCEPPSNVIHAPQQMRHFEILIQVLGLDDLENINRNQASSPWWQRAWVEIRRSRGEAIQSGFLEREIVDEQLLAILHGLLPQIQERAAERASFEVPIPLRSDVHGSFIFYPVIAVEHGFHVPETELKIIQELKTTDKWRD